MVAAPVRRHQDPILRRAEAIHVALLNNDALGSSSYFRRNASSRGGSENRGTLAPALRAGLVRFRYQQETLTPNAGSNESARVEE
jgi:hypothetical protein